MTGLGADDLLRLYERGRDQGAWQRACLLSAAAGADGATLGDIDRAVWRMRCAMVGQGGQALVTCSGCGAQIEIDLPVGFTPPDRQSEDTVPVVFDGETHLLRFPTLADVTPRGVNRAALCPDAPWADPGFVDAAETALAEADPGLRLQLTLHCADCGAAQAPDFDLLGFVWSELDAMARRLVSEIGQLARGYGWREADLLAMSARRRALYLEELAT